MEGMVDWGSGVSGQDIAYSEQHIAGSGKRSAYLVSRISQKVGWW